MHGYLVFRTRAVTALFLLGRWWVAVCCACTPVLHVPGVMGCRSTCTLRALLMTGVAVY